MIQPNLQLTLKNSVMMLWSTKAPSYEKNARDHLPPPQIFLEASEKQWRKYWGDSKPDSRQVQSLLALEKSISNEIKSNFSFLLKRMVRSSVRVPILGGRCTTLYYGAVISESICYPVQSAVCVSPFDALSIFLQTVHSYCPPSLG